MVYKPEIQIGVKELLGHALVNLRLAWRELSILIAAYSIWLLIDIGPPLSVLNWFVLIGGSYFIYRAILKHRGLLEDSDIRVFSFLGMAIVLGLAIGIGVTFFVVPGALLAAKWIMAPSFLVARNRTIFDAAGDSWRATTGYVRTIFPVLAIVWVGTVALLAVIGTLADGIVRSFNSSAEEFFDALLFPALLIVMMGLSTALLELIGHRSSTKREADKLAEAFD